MEKNEKLESEKIAEKIVQKEKDIAWAKFFDRAYTGENAIKDLEELNALYRMLNEAVMKE